MTKIMKCEVLLDEEERERTIALSREMGVTMGALFRSVLYGKIPKTPKKEEVKTLLKLGEVDEQIDELINKIPLEDRRKFRELQESIRELENRLCQ